MKDGQVASVNVTSKPVDPAGSEAKVDFTIAEGPWRTQTFSFKAQGVSEFSVTVQMLPHPPRYSAPQIHPSISINSTSQSSTAPSPSLGVKSPPTLPVGSTVSDALPAAQGQGGHERLGSASSRAPPLSNLTSVQAASSNIASSKPLEGNTEANVSSEFLSHTKPEQKVAFTPQQNTSAQARPIPSVISLSAVPETPEQSSRTLGGARVSVGSQDVMLEAKGNVVEAESLNNRATSASKTPEKIPSRDSPSIFTASAASLSSSNVMTNSSCETSLFAPSGPLGQDRSGFLVLPNLLALLSTIPEFPKLSPERLQYSTF